MSRQLQRQETRRRLLDAAYQVICDRSMLNTHVSDIAQAAGVSHGALFVHFEWLEELIAAAVAEYGGGIARSTHELASKAQALRNSCARTLRVLANTSRFVRLVIESWLMPQAVRDMWVGIQSAVSFYLSKLVVRDLPGADTALFFDIWVRLV